MGYTIILEQVETDSGVKWMAKIPSLHGVTGGGSTQEEALAVLNVEMKEMLSFLEDEGEEIPEPDYLRSKKGYSGRITYRPGKQLHAELDSYAKENEISINSVISNAVSRYIVEQPYIKAIEEFKSSSSLLDQRLHVLIKHTENLSNATKYNVDDTELKPWAKVAERWGW